MSGDDSQKAMTADKRRAGGQKCGDEGNDLAGAEGREPAHQRADHDHPRLAALEGAVEQAFGSAGLHPRDGDDREQDIGQRAPEMVQRFLDGRDHGGRVEDGDDQQDQRARQRHLVDPVPNGDDRAGGLRQVSHGWCAFRMWDRALIGAAFGDEKARERLDLGDHDRAEDAPSVAALLDQSGRDEVFDMMGQDRAGHAHILAQARRSAGPPTRAHQAAQDRQARLGAKAAKAVAARVRWGIGAGFCSMFL
jgi:hypothetical protein